MGCRKGSMSRQVYREGPGPLGTRVSRLWKLIDNP